MLTALIERPDRLVYLSSGLHRGGEGSLRDLDWTERPLFLARRWPEVLSNAVDPGWVRTRMGGASAPVDIHTGQRTQSWLAVSTEPAAMVTGRYWHRMKPELPADEAMDVAFKMVARLQDLTGVALPNAGERFHGVVAPSKRQLG